MSGSLIKWADVSLGKKRRGTTFFCTLAKKTHPVISNDTRQFLAMAIFLFLTRIGAYSHLPSLSLSVCVRVYRVYRMRVDGSALLKVSLVSRMPNPLFIHTMELNCADFVGPGKSQTVELLFH